MMTQIVFAFVFFMASVSQAELGGSQGGDPIRGQMEQNTYRDADRKRAGKTSELSGAKKDDIGNLIERSKSADSSPDTETCDEKSIAAYSRDSRTKEMIKNLEKNDPKTPPAVTRNAGFRLVSEHIENSKLAKKSEMPAGVNSLGSTSTEAIQKLKSLGFKNIANCDQYKADKDGVSRKPYPEGAIIIYRRSDGQLMGDYIKVQISRGKCTFDASSAANCKGPNDSRPVAVFVK